MKKLGIGIMSGTSLDGIDVIITEIEGTFKNTKVKELAFKTYPFSEEMICKINRAWNNKKSFSELLCSLNFELGYAFSNAVKQICKDSNIPLEDIDFIASHGQTIYHIPEDTRYFVRSSLQLGEGSVIANECNTTVVSNFRTADMAVGGQGAPLVPYADYVLFRDEIKSRVLLNIGGIANITYLKKNPELEDVVAFDTGPGNMMIDYCAERLFNHKFDKDGLLARKGKVLPEMLDDLLSNGYYSLKYPKSTGREMFGKDYTEEVITKYSNNDKHDILCTLTHLTAITISDCISTFDVDEVVVSGGGANNKYLIELIQNQLRNVEVKRIEELGYNSNSKEALAFVILGNETLNLNTSNVKSATGAKKYVLLGQINHVIK